MERAGGALRGNQLHRLYDRLDFAKGIIHEAGGLRSFCDRSDRLRFIADPPPNSRPGEVRIARHGELERQLAAEPEPEPQGEPEARCIPAHVQDAAVAAAKLQEHENPISTTTCISTWTGSPNIPAAETDALQRLVELAVEEQLPATWSKDPLKALDDVAAAEKIRALFHAHDVDKTLQTSLVGEAIRGTAARNREKLYRDPAKINRLREQIGTNPAQLRKHAEEINVTTTQLAEVLAGTKLVGMTRKNPIPAVLARPAFPRPQSVLVGWFRSFSQRKAIAVEAVKIANQKEEQGQWSDAAMQLRRHGGTSQWRGEEEQLAAGKRGETTLVKDLRAAGLRRFCREEKLMADGKPFTPDVLFDEPQHINGHEVNWIDAKNALLIPGVSDEGRVQRHRQQFKNYVDSYGPGAVLWLKCGFSERWVDDQPGVVHFRRNGPASNHRTQLCRHWQAGHCWRGDRCIFAHGVEQLR
eukprot:COSAG04_NODE_2505_length_3995_cov_23.581366_3_plen_470_part_00